MRGTSFDAFDRPISKLELAYGTAPVTKNMYDQSGQLDLLSQTKNALGQITTYAYDKINRVAQLSFSGPAPQADGRTYQLTRTEGRRRLRTRWERLHIRMTSTATKSALPNPMAALATQLLL